MNIKPILAAALFLFIAIAGAQQTISQERNPLGLVLYVIETTGVPERASEAGNFMQDHLAHQDNLERQGIMFGAGALRSEGAEGGPPTQGLIIIRAESFEEARKIADSDPMHANGLRTYTIRRWSLNEGTVNIRVNFSDQSVEFK
jgi:hypothetical protein